MAAPPAHPSAHTSRNLIVVVASLAMIFAGAGCLLYLFVWRAH